MESSAAGTCKLPMPRRTLKHSEDDRAGGFELALNSMRVGECYRDPHGVSWKGFYNVKPARDETLDEIPLTKPGIRSELAAWRRFYTWGETHESNQCKRYSKGLSSG